MSLDMSDIAAKEMCRSWCVFFTKQDGKGARLWSESPHEAMALQMFEYCKSKALPSKMTLIWVTQPTGNHATDHMWEMET